MTVRTENPPSTTERIIAAAERRMREGGFHGFSFREIAADVGIKSASVHHHFPTKEDLGAAVVRSYTDSFIGTLGDPADPKRSPSELKALYIDAFRKSFGAECRMCLCGLLSTEASSMPSGINSSVREFFQRNLDWIETVLARSAPELTRTDVKAQALRVVALLEGAMLLAHSLGNSEAFEQILTVLEEPAFIPEAAKERRQSPIA